MNNTVRFVFLLVVALNHATTLFGQETTIKLKNHTQQRTTLTSVTPVQLFTLNGVIALNQIKSISFWGAAPDSTSIARMRAGGIAVYLRQTRLGPLVEMDSTLYFNTQLSLGVGLGLDYGGAGLKLELFTSELFGLFAGGGVIGFNVGTELKFSPHKINTAYIIGMYGANAVYQDKTYYGFTAGVGGRRRLGKENGGYFTAALVVPFRDQVLLDELENGNAKGVPILFSFGINFNIGK